MRHGDGGVVTRARAEERTARSGAKGEDMKIKYFETTVGEDEQNKKRERRVEWTLEKEVLDAA